MNRDQYQLKNPDRLLLPRAGRDLAGHEEEACRYAHASLAELCRSRRVIHLFNGRGEEAAESSD